MKKADLLKEIDLVLSVVEAPSISNIVLHGDECPECQNLKKDLEDIVAEEITAETIRFFHQELYHLSAEGWRWLLPYYLKYCVTPEAEYTQSETEFLIYNLRPSEGFEAETKKRLSALNEPQINCLIHFLDWCISHPFWKEYCPDDILKAKIFLSNQIDQNKIH